MNRVSHLLPSIERLAMAASNLLLGACCPGCGVPGWAVCRQCRALLPVGVQPVRRTGLELPDGLVCGAYAEPLSRLLIAHKDEGAWQLAGLLGALLARAVAGLTAHPTVLSWCLPTSRGAAPVTTMFGVTNQAGCQLAGSGRC